jgi:hypothetical protein
MNNLSEYLIIEILCYLRSNDLATLLAVNKVLFDSNRIRLVIQKIMESSPNLILPTSPFKKQMNLAMSIHRPDSLFVYEIISILAAINYPQPIKNTGNFVLSSFFS